MAQLQSMRATFQKVGLRTQSRVLNLGGTLLSNIYPLSQTQPPQKKFFPLATMATAPMRQLLKNRQDICTGEKCDFLLLTVNQRLSPACPSVPVTTNIKEGKLYKFSPLAPPEGAESRE